MRRENEAQILVVDSITKLDQSHRGHAARQPRRSSHVRTARGHAPSTGGAKAE